MSELEYHIEAHHSNWIQLFQHLLQTSHVLKPGPPVLSSQLPLYFEDFCFTSPTRSHCKVHVSPEVFNAVVLCIAKDKVFHSSSHVPQFPVYIQLAIFLIHIRHYGNVASPEDITQFAGVSVGTVENTTYRCLIAILWMHDTLVMFPMEDEKEKVKQYVKDLTLCGMMEQASLSWWY